MDILKITEAKRQLHIQNACIDDSEFFCASMKQLKLEDVTMAGTKIINADLSDIEIEGAQLGGAYIHNIGMPPQGHPHYEAGAKQRPLLLEHCDLEKSIIRNCNLSGVELMDCDISGMKINGVLIEGLLKQHQPEI